MAQLNEIQMFEGSTTKMCGNQILPPENIISMEVTEKMNDGLSLTMVCAISDSNIKNLVVGNIVKCYKDTLKKSMFSFEIYDVKYSIDHKITVKAEHLSSRLRYIYVEPITQSVTPYNLGEILSGISSTNKYMLINYTGDSPIRIRLPYNDNGVISKRTISDSIKSISDIMMGTDGSILDIFGQGRWEYTGDREMTFNPETDDSTDKPLKPIRYADNMSDFKREIDMDNAKSTQVLFWKKEVDGVVQQIWTCNRKTSDIYPMQAAQLCDLSSQFETKPTAAQLVSVAPTVSTSPEITTTCTITNYEDKQATVGKNVVVYFPELGIEEKMRITETTYNVILEKYKSIKIGTLKKTLSRTIAEITSKTGVSVY